MRKTDTLFSIHRELKTINTVYKSKRLSYAMYCYFWY